MGCPILEFLPEIADVANHLDGPKTESKLLAVARNVCQACREKETHQACPLGEPFGSSLQCCLPEIVKVAVRMMEKQIREKRGE